MLISTLFLTVYGKLKQTVLLDTLVETCIPFDCKMVWCVMWFYMCVHVAAVVVVEVEQCSHWLNPLIFSETLRPAKSVWWANVCLEPKDKRSFNIMILWRTPH